MEWKIILGGMGVGVTNSWFVREFCQAAKKLSVNALGVVSLTAIADVAVRRLQFGDERMLRALNAFPVQEVSRWIRGQYFIEGGKEVRTPFKSIPMFDINPSDRLAWLVIFASFAEVWLAKEKTDFEIGANLLEKVQMPLIFSILGAIWSGVDALIIGAGLPTQIPDVIDAIMERREVRYKLFVANAPSGRDFWITLNIERMLEKVSKESRRKVHALQLKRPYFLPIVTLDVTASAVLRSRKRFDGLIIEERIAGGHNAGPRNWKGETNEQGEPIYGPRDEVKYNLIRKLGLPFWCAGGYGNSMGLLRAAGNGAQGIQIGGICALAKGSGLANKHRVTMLELLFENKLKVRADPKISPSGFPFQVVNLPSSIADPKSRKERQLICDLGYLRHAYYYEDKHGEGKIGWRCPAEHPESYVRKGGKIEDTLGAGCICNGLMSVIGYAQLRKDGKRERPVATLGKDLGGIHQLIRGGSEYYIEDALRLILNG